MSPNCDPMQLTPSAYYPALYCRRKIRIQGKKETGFDKELVSWVVNLPGE
jgi:hypothetical protein